MRQFNSFTQFCKNSDRFLVTIGKQYFSGISIQHSFPACCCCIYFTFLSLFLLLSSLLCVYVGGNDSGNGKSSVPGLISKYHSSNYLGSTKEIQRNPQAEQMRDLNVKLQNCKLNIVKLNHHAQSPMGPTHLVSCSVTQNRGGSLGLLHVKPCAQR